MANPKGNMANLAKRPRGRPVGSQNKTSIDAKKALEYAFDKAGGQERLAEFAIEKPEVFYGIWAKLLPKDVKVEHSGAVDIMVKTASELEKKLRGPSQINAPAGS